MGNMDRAPFSTLNHSKTNIICSGTFGKSLGGAGAFISCSNEMADFLVNSCRSLIYTTAMSPIQLAINLDGLKLLSSKKNPGKTIKKKITLFNDILDSHRLKTTNNLSPIIPILVGSNERTVKIEEAMLNSGYFAPAIRPPTVKEGQARIRICLSDLYSEKEIIKIAQDICQIINNFLKTNI